VRVVNLSWSGANSDTVEAGAFYLKSKGGIVGMSALDGAGAANYTNQPNVYCVAMTDSADNFNSTKFGSYIDFAAPGYQIFSTTTGAGYTSGTGTSYACPLFCGVISVLMSINPALGPDDIINILRTTAADLGPTGTDQFYGAGRINFAAAAAAARAALPSITGVQALSNQLQITAPFYAGVTYSLQRTRSLSPATWSSLTNVIASTNAGQIRLIDPSPLGFSSFYRLQISR